MRNILYSHFQSYAWSACDAFVLKPSVTCKWNWFETTPLIQPKTFSNNRWSFRCWNKIKKKQNTHTHTTKWSNILWAMVDYPIEFVCERFTVYSNRQLTFVYLCVFVTHEIPSKPVVFNFWIFELWSVCERARLWRSKKKKKGVEYLRTICNYVRTW